MNSIEKMFEENLEIIKKKKESIIENIAKNESQKNELSKIINSLCNICDHMSDVKKENPLFEIKVSIIGLLTIMDLGMEELKKLNDLMGIEIIIPSTRKKVFDKFSDMLSSLPPLGDLLIKNEKNSILLNDEGKPMSLEEIESLINEK